MHDWALLQVKRWLSCSKWWLAPLIFIWLWHLYGSRWDVIWIWLVGWPHEIQSPPFFSSFKSYAHPYFTDRVHQWYFWQVFHAYFHELAMPLLLMVVGSFTSSITLPEELHLALSERSRRMWLLRCFSLVAIPAYLIFVLFPVLSYILAIILNDYSIANCMAVVCWTGLPLAALMLVAIALLTDSQQSRIWQYSIFGMTVLILARVGFMLYQRSRDWMFQFGTANYTATESAMTPLLPLSVVAIFVLGFALSRLRSLLWSSQPRG
ncbi:MAG: hypothetical protein R3F46_13505 [bacterium]